MDAALKEIDNRTGHYKIHNYIHDQVKDWHSNWNSTDLGSSQFKRTWNTWNLNGPIASFGRCSTCTKASSRDLVTGGICSGMVYQ